MDKSNQLRPGPAQRGVIISPKGHTGVPGSCPRVLNANGPPGGGDAVPVTPPGNAMGQNKLYSEAVSPRLGKFTCSPEGERVSQAPGVSGPPIPSGGEDSEMPEVSGSPTPSGNQEVEDAVARAAEKSSARLTDVEDVVYESADGGAVTNAPAHRMTQWTREQQEEADRLANQPIPPSNRGRGRGRGGGRGGLSQAPGVRKPKRKRERKGSGKDGPLPPQQADEQSPNLEPKRTKEQGHGFKSAAERALRVVFVYKDDVQRELSVEDCDWVRETAVGWITDFDTAAGGLTPQFLQSGRSEGVFLVTCANEATKKWLLDLGSDMVRPSDGAVFRAAPYSEILGRSRYTVRIKSTKNKEQIMELLKKQNPALGVERWQVWHFAKVQDNVRFLVLGLDKQSSALLSGVNKQVYFELGRLTLQEGEAKP